MTGMPILEPNCLVPIPKPLDIPRFDRDPAPPIKPMPIDLAASFVPVELLVESISILSIALTLLLCRLCLLGAVVPFDLGRLEAAAPGPGVSLGGAAAIGTTPLPPLNPAVPTEDPAEP